VRTTVDVAGEGVSPCTLKGEGNVPYVADAHRVLDISRESVNFGEGMRSSASTASRRIATKLAFKDERAPLREPKRAVEPLGRIVLGFGGDPNGLDARLATLSDARFDESLPNTPSSERGGHGQVVDIQLRRLIRVPVNRSEALPSDKSVCHSDHQHCIGGTHAACRPPQVDRLIKTLGVHALEDGEVGGLNSNQRDFHRTNVPHTRNGSKRHDPTCFGMSALLSLIQRAGPYSQRDRSRVSAGITTYVIETIIVADTTNTRPT
jgi:hypothetical protein